MREVPPTAGLPLELRDFWPGPTPPFEHSLASFLGVPTVQIECSGTAALVVILTALAATSHRRRVILPAYTCPLVLLAIVHCQLDPVLCDLQPGHFDFDHQALARHCNEDTLAIIPTHLGGRVANLQPVLEMARRFGAHVIEDAAQSLGASWQGVPVGMAGDAGFYSLAVGKGLTLFEGGVLVASRDAMRLELRATSEKIIPRNIPREILRWTQLLGYASLYRPAGLSLAYGIPLRRALRRGNLIEAVGDNFSADIPLHSVGRWRKALGAQALKRLPAFQAQLNTQAMQRLSRLAAIPHISVIRDAPGNHGMWPFFMILMPDREARDAALEKLWPAGVGASRLYLNALNEYPYLSRHITSSDTPNAHDFSARMLTISNSPWLDDAGFESICRVLEAKCSFAPSRVVTQTN